MAHRVSVSAQKTISLRIGFVVIASLQLVRQVKGSAAPRETVGVIDNPTKPDMPSGRSAPETAAAVDIQDLIGDLPGVSEIVHRLGAGRKVIIIDDYIPPNR